MKTILITLATLVSLNITLARTGDECKINVYKPDITRISEVSAAMVINQILVQKGYIPVEGYKAKLNHNATKLGYSDTGCSSNNYDFKRVRAMAYIAENGKYLDLQTADGIESEQSCANLDQARIEATQKLKPCSDL